MVIIMKERQNKTFAPKTVIGFNTFEEWGGNKGVTTIIDIAGDETYTDKKGNQVLSFIQRGLGLIFSDDRFRPADLIEQVNTYRQQGVVVDEVAQQALQRATTYKSYTKRY